MRERENELERYGWMRGSDKGQEKEGWMDGWREKDGWMRQRGMNQREMDGWMRDEWMDEG